MFCKLHAKEYFRLARFQTAALTALAPVWGALAFFPKANIVTLFEIFVVGLSCHVFGFVLNEIADLGIDKSSKSLAEKPLVSGGASLKGAKVLVLVQLPVIFGIPLILLRAGIIPLTVLALAVLLASIYDFYGKRFLLSPALADLTLGISVGLLTMFAAFLVAQQKYGLANEVAAFSSIFSHYSSIWIALGLASMFALDITFNNGIEGGLKDLENDLAVGARSTPISLGAQINGSTILEPLGLRTYGTFLRVLSLIIAPIILFLGLPGYNLTETVIASVGIVILIVLTLQSLLRFLRSQINIERKELLRIFGIQEILAYIIIPFTLVFYIGIPSAVLMIVIPLGWYALCNSVLYGRALRPNV